MNTCCLEYIAGLVKGDGCLYYNRKAREYVIEIYDRDIEFINIIASVLRNCGYNTFVKSYETYHRVRINSKELYKVLSSLIKNLLETPSVNFVRGLLDSDGTFYYDRRKRNPIPIVELANKDRAVIMAASRVYAMLNIRYSIKIYRRAGKPPLHKVVSRGENAVNLLLKIKPLHPIKFKLFKPL